MHTHPNVEVLEVPDAGHAPALQDAAQQEVIHRVVTKTLIKQLRHVMSEICKQQDIYTVSRLQQRGTLTSRKMFAYRLGRRRNFQFCRTNSGHWYFSLKDASRSSTLRHVSR